MRCRNQPVVVMSVTVAKEISIHVQPVTEQGMKNKRIAWHVKIPTETGQQIRLAGQGEADLMVDLMVTCM